MAKKKNEEVVPSGDTYVVYCKLPCGMSFPLPGGKTLALNGANHKNESGTSLTIIGYGRTEVAKRDWEYIMEIYSSLKVFSEDNPVIFAAENREDGDAIARDVGPTVRSGMEQRAPKEIIRKAEQQANNPQPQE